jgi:hypothetical protein
MHGNFDVLTDKDMDILSKDKYLSAKRQYITPRNFQGMLKADTCFTPQAMIHFSKGKWDISCTLDLTNRKPDNRFGIGKKVCKYLSRAVLPSIH